MPARYWPSPCAVECAVEWLIEHTSYEYPSFMSMASALDYYFCSGSSSKHTSNFFYGPHDKFGLRIMVLKACPWIEPFTLSFPCTRPACCFEQWAFHQAWLSASLLWDCESGLELVWLQIREARVLQWVKPRAAAVKSLRLRGSAGGKARQDIVDDSALATSELSKWGDFSGYISDLETLLAPSSPEQTCHTNEQLCLGQFCPMTWSTCALQPVGDNNNDGIQKPRKDAASVQRRHQFRQSLASWPKHSFWL